MNLTHKNMKKTLLFGLLAFAAAALHAQNDGHKNDVYEIMAHNMGEYQFTIENFMRQRDGDLLFGTFVSLEGSGYSSIGVGDIFYKMSPTTFAVTDSLFVEDPEAPYYLFAPNPAGEGNIRANFEYVEACDSTFLRICHFPDNDLNINHDEDIVVPVCAGFACGNYDSHMVDCRGDLIMKYSMMRPDGGFDEYIARFGVDGTLKHQALLFENQTQVIPKLRVLKESPLQYYQWKSYNQYLAFWVIDSIFHKNPVGLNRVLSEESLCDTIEWVAREYLKFNIDTEVVPIGGNEILVAAQYAYDTNYYPITAEYGVAVAKYDIRTMQLKDYIVFNDYNGYDGQATCLGLAKMPDGAVYLLYKEIGYPEESIVVVKMDTDLNMEWKRFCKTGNISLLYGTPLYFPSYRKEQGEEEGVTWAGYGRNADGGLCLVCLRLNHDGMVSVDEKDMEIRPYAYYPNPAQDELHLQYSPDITPTQIELYDLQGRLVRSQRNGLERLNLEGLASGAYTMRVTLEGGKVFSEKVVKE